ncbi:MAG: ATP-binding protein [Spirochaetaceae bacterium]|nr:ATP-binding protein [Spirochaetaceae bacterium]
MAIYPNRTSQKTNYITYKRLERALGDFSEIPGHPILKRALEICSAGLHNLLLFGPPDSGIDQVFRSLKGIARTDNEVGQVQHILTAGACPCGNLGIDFKICRCSQYDLRRYWKRFGGVDLVRFDMRVPLIPPESPLLLLVKHESMKSIRKRVNNAMTIQKTRFTGKPYSCNARIPAGVLKDYCRLDDETRALFTETVRLLSLSPQACHSILKITRTIADLHDCLNIGRDHFLEAVYYRRYGDRDIFWNEI